MITGTIHVDRVLTNLSIKYDDFSDVVMIADKVCPLVPVNKQSDKYFVYGREYLKAQDLKKSPRGESAEMYRSLSTDSYFCDEYGIKDFITENDMINADEGQDPEADSVEALTDVIMLNHERAVATLFTDTDNYAATNKKALSGTSQWSDQTNSTPYADIYDAKVQVRKSGRRANTMIAAYSVALALAEHPNTQEKLALETNERLSAELGDKWTSETGLPAKIKGLRLYVPSGVVDGAEDGATADIADIWGNNVWIGHVTQKKTPSRKTISFALNFVWKVKGLVRRVYKWENPAKDVRGTWVDVEEAFDVKVIAQSLGYLLSNVIA